MPEDSSINEVRRITEELARERAWMATPASRMLHLLAAAAFDLAHAAEAWSARAGEAWIAAGDQTLSPSLIQPLLEQVAAVTAVVNADFN